MNTGPGEGGGRTVCLEGLYRQIQKVILFPDTAVGYCIDASSPYYVRTLVFHGSLLPSSRADVIGIDRLW